MNKLKSFLFVIAILFMACVKEPPCTNDGKPTVSNVKEEDRAKIPYHSFAELTFIDSVTLDTHVFYGQGWKQNYWHYFNQDQNPHCYYGTNCELYRQTFTSSSYSDKLEIGIDLVRPGHPYLIISLNYRSYKTSPVNIGFPYTQDSLIIKNRIYRNVNEINNNFQNSNAIKKYLTFFNVSHGILKIQLNETTLELLNFKNP